MKVQAMVRLFWDQFILVDHIDHFGPFPKFTLYSLQYSCFSMINFRVMHIFF